MRLHQDQDNLLRLVKKYHCRKRISRVKMVVITLLALLSVAFAAPLAEHGRDDLIPGKYIVKFKTDLRSSAEQDLRASVAAPFDFEYSLEGFTGFAATLSDEEVTNLQSSDLVSHNSNEKVR